MVSLQALPWLSMDRLKEEEREPPLQALSRLSTRRSKGKREWLSNALTEEEMKLLQHVDLQKHKKGVSVYGGDARRYTYMDGCD